MVGPDTPCPACDGIEFRLYRNVHSQISAIPEGLDRGDDVDVRIERCRNCGLFRSLPVSDNRSIETLYEDDSICFDASASKLAAGNNAISSTDELSIVDTAPPARLLDVGCGAGQFLLRCQSLGFDVMGVEIDPLAVEFACRELGLNVRTGGIFAVEDEEKFDIVSALGVLEHVERPAAFLDALAKHLTPGGEILIGVPNAACLNRIVSRASAHDWDMFLEPGHLYSYDIKCLSSLAKRCGLRCKRWMTATLTIRGKIPLLPARHVPLERGLIALTDNNPLLQRAYVAGLRALDRARGGDMLFATFVPED